MPRFLAGTRYLVLIPVLGLGVAAGVFFVIGGLGLLRTLAELLVGLVQTHAAPHDQPVPIAVHIVEYVHQFLIGTVLYITAVGLFQLFIRELDVPDWLKVEDTEALETNLIGVTIVVLAVNFLSTAFASDAATVLRYGAGIALPIAALALFVGIRTWSTLADRRSHAERGSAVNASASSSDDA